MEPSRYRVLIHKQHTGELTPEEQHDLDRWLEADAKNRKAYETLQRILQLPDTGISADRKQQQRARLLERVHQDVRSNAAVFRVHRVAALLVMLTASVLILVYALRTPVTISAHGKQNLYLADSSHIILQPEATISFYYSDELTASFEGQGLFEVTHGAAITLHDATVHASAASFLIISRPGSDAHIEVLSGEVTVSARQRTIVVRANQQCIVNPAGLQVSRLQMRSS